MAFELPVELMSLQANAALATAAAAGNVQFTLAAVDAEGNVGINATAGGACFGVIQSQPAYEGDAVDIMVAGISKVVCGAAVGLGDQVTSDANGHVVVASGTVPLGTLTTALTDSDAVTELAVTALAAAVADGDSVTVTSGGHTQTFTASAAAAEGATSISVTSADANFSYPVGSAAADSTADSGGSVVGTCIGATANPGEIASVQLGTI